MSKPNDPASSWASGYTRAQAGMATDWSDPAAVAGSNFQRNVQRWDQDRRSAQAATPVPPVYSGRDFSAAQRKAQARSDLKLARRYLSLWTEAADRLFKAKSLSENGFAGQDHAAAWAGLDELSRKACFDRVRKGLSADLNTIIGQSEAAQKLAYRITVTRRGRRLSDEIGEACRKTRTLTGWALSDDGSLLRPEARQGYAMMLFLTAREDARRRGPGWIRRSKLRVLAALLAAGGLCVVLTMALRMLS